VSRIGIGEISIVALLLFILAPDAVPALMRKIGRYVALLRKLSKDAQDQIIAPMTGKAESAGSRMDGQDRRQGATVHDQAGESPTEKLERLDAWRGRYMPQHAEQTLRLAVDDDPRVREKARQVLLLDPLFAFELRRFGPVQPEAGRQLSHLEQFFSAERIARLSAALNGIPDDRLDRYMGSLCELPGIQSLDLSRIFAGPKEGLKDRFLSLCSRFERRRYPVQITVAPSYRCNLSCSYCFSQTLDRRFPREMTPAELGAMLDRVTATTPLQRVGLLGGEPTLAHGIEGYVEELEKRSLSFYFATNGLAPAPRFRAVVGSSRLEMVTFHIEEDRFYQEGQIDALRANIAAVDQNRVTVVLRYNLSDRDFQDWSFLHKYLGILVRPSVSFAVVFPSRVGAANRVSLDELQAFRPRILSLVRYLVEATGGKPHSISFAKPYPLCMFDAQELRFLMRKARLRNVCELDRNDSTNNICVNPDLSFFPCMALNSEEFRFPHIEAFDALEERYRETIRSVVKTPLLLDCRQCLLHARGVCQAACYAYL
jgi:radical SAM protein with 4Fe4S-binding SPASM domain